MSERNCKFVSKEYEVSYEVSKEELDVLNRSYNHQHYCERRQYVHNRVVMFSEMNMNYLPEEIIRDLSCDVEREATSRIEMEELLGVLTDEERSVVERLFLDERYTTELEDELKMSRFAIARTRNRAVKKMTEYLAKQGVTSYREARIKLF